MPHDRFRASIVAVLVLVAAPLTYAQQPTSGNGVVVTATAMYLTPDAARTPLATLPFGAPVRVVAKEGDWYKIVFRDQYLGERTGYVPASTVRIEAPTVPPTPPSPPPPPVPGQVNPQAAAAQPIIISQTAMAPKHDNGFLWLSGTFQRESTAFTANTTFASTGGTATVTTRYDGVQSNLGDVAIGQRVWQDLSVSVAGTYAAQITDGHVTAVVPHPLGGAARTVSGIASAIHRTEVGIHIDASWGFPSTGRAQVVIFAGPSIFRVKQDLVTAVTVNESFPFDSATFASATVVESKKTHVGYNGGFEASVRVYKALGIGVLARYSQAKIPFSPAAGTNPTVKVGGLQGGAGLHFRF